MHTLTRLPKSQAELTITVTTAEYQADLQPAAARLSERAAIKGFRPGKAPYDIVKRQLGEQKILEEAAEKIIQRTYFAAAKAENLATIGRPAVNVQKLAPGNDLVYRATVTLLPAITLPDMSIIRVEKKSVSVGGQEVADVLENLKKMQPREAAKPGAAAKDDKVTIAMDMFIDAVPVEGGQAKNHQVYLAEPHYIPGLAEQLVGLKKDDTKEFTLKFPAEHYQKHLAGRDVNFKIKVNEVFSLEYPAFDDAFAKSLGQESLEKLKELLLANLTREAEKKEAERFEIAILETLIGQTQFGELPDILIDSEKRKMFYELKNDLERRGLNFEDYLKNLKKTEAQIFEDFAAGALQRAKAALVSRQVAKENAVTVEKADLDKELELIKKAYEHDAKALENLARPEVLDTIAATVQNRKVMEFLKKKILS